MVHLSVSQRWKNSGLNLVDDEVRLPLYSGAGKMIVEVFQYELMSKYLNSLISQ